MISKVLTYPIVIYFLCGSPPSRIVYPLGRDRCSTQAWFEAYSIPLEVVVEDLLPIFIVVLFSTAYTTPR
jgi:hypothetical protein